MQAKGAVCADCGAEQPEWASINLCVPLCLECAGCHRSMGTHVSRVRSLLLDSWEPQLVRLIEDVYTAPLTHQPKPLPSAAADGKFDITSDPSNAPAAPSTSGVAPSVGPNAVWEARLPSTVRRPARSDGAEGPGPREHRCSIRALGRACI